jgi:hypothetical protein
MLEFRVREGAVGEIAKVTDRCHWRRWTTTKTLNFREPERRSRTMVVFRTGMWLLRVNIFDVSVHDGARW